MPAAPDEFTAYCVELLGALGPARSRRMFGGHGLYVDDLFIALIADDVLYLKVDAQTRDRFEAAGCRPFVYDGKARAVTMSYFSAPQEAMDSPPAMRPWARLAFEAALRAQVAKASSGASARRKASATRAETKPSARKPAAPAAPAVVRARRKPRPG